MAIVHPNEGHLRASVKSGAISGAQGDWDLHKLCETSAVSQHYLQSLNATGKAAGFKPLELLQTVLVVPDELDVTAAQKIERKKIEAKYKDAIAKVYP